MSGSGSPSAERCVPGDWVEVERTLLAPTERSVNVPPETAETPLTMWVKGFARADAPLGEELEITTATGRVVRGRLSAVRPGYAHTFGRPPRELTHVGPDLRARVAAWRAGAGSDEAGPGGPGPEAGG